MTELQVDVEAEHKTKAQDPEPEPLERARKMRPRTEWLAARRHSLDRDRDWFLYVRET